MRIYVRTGPSFDDAGCNKGQDFLVKVELLLSGLQPKDFAQHVVNQSLAVGAQEFKIETLSVMCLLINKIGTYLNGFAIKDYQDILLLLQKYQVLVEARRDELDLEETEAFLEEVLASPVGPQAQKDWMKGVLLGRTDEEKISSPVVER